MFTPWVNYRLYGNGQTPTRQQELFGWGLLPVMVVLAVVFVLVLRAGFAAMQRGLPGSSANSKETK